MAKYTNGSSEGSRFLILGMFNGYVVSIRPIPIPTNGGIILAVRIRVTLEHDTTVYNTLGEDESGSSIVPELDGAVSIKTATAMSSVDSSFPHVEFTKITKVHASTVIGSTQLYALGAVEGDPSPIAHGSKWMMGVIDTLKLPTGEYQDAADLYEDLTNLYLHSAEVVNNNIQEYIASAKKEAENTITATESGHVGDNVVYLDAGKEEEPEAKS
jgi:hypothetical protein